MKKQLIISILVLVVLIAMPACKKFVWDPVGGWTFAVDSDEYGIWTETVTLNGSETGGTVSNWNKFNPDSTEGTWSKSGDYTINIKIDYWNFGIFHNIVELTGTTTKDSPNNLTLTGTWTTVFLTTTTSPMTVNAIKTSGLQ